MSTEGTQTIEQAASVWLIRRDSDAWTPADEVRLRAWLEASSLNRVAFWRLEMAWAEAARLKALGAGIVGDRPPPRGEWTLTPFFESRDQSGAAPGDEGAIEADTHFLPREPPARPRRGFVFTGLVSVATLLLVVAVAAHYWLSRPANRYSTPVGGIASVPLKDGSRITLNTATEVQVALSGKERDIELARGEAFFDVAKDAKRPFVVNAGKKRVIAVGTQFSVLRDGNDVRVIVSEGTVRIEDRSQTPAPPVLPLTAAASADAVLLSAGSVAHAGADGVLVQQEPLTQIEAQLSWRSGFLMFRDQTLAAAAAEFNRYNERQIVIRDPIIAGLKIEGNFRATNVDAFIRLLESGFPIHATESDGQIVLSSN